MAKITPTREDYIRAVYLLQEQGIQVRIIDIAHYLHLARSTVSERIHDLEHARLIKTGRSGGIIFTAQGQKLGEQLTYKHRLIEVFLFKTLGVDPKKVHAEAHKLEHAFSEDVVKRLAKFLGNPSTDPHGKKIRKV
jgi:DtxR family Mn-dependent transcriptional regulator